MIKYYNYGIAFSEFPDEIALCINITNCIGCCENCSEPWLKEDTGTELTFEELDKILEKYPDISIVGFMGGDHDHETLKKLAEYVHSKQLKAGLYSGQEYLDLSLIDAFDYYKIGRWIMPKGEVENWWKTNCGPLKFTFSNQLMFKKVDGKLVNITNRFREKPLNNLKKEIIA